MRGRRLSAVPPCLHSHYETVRALPRVSTFWCGGLFDPDISEPVETQDTLNDTVMVVFHACPAAAACESLRS